MYMHICIYTQWKRASCRTGRSRTRESANASNTTAFGVNTHVFNKLTQLASNLGYCLIRLFQSYLLSLSLIRCQENVRRRPPTRTVSAELVRLLPLEFADDWERAARSQHVEFSDRAN